MAITPYPRPVAERPIDRLSQANAHVLGGVVPVNMQVARAADRQVHQRMTREQVEHVIEEPNARCDLGPPLTVEVEFQADVGFASFAHNLGAAWRNTQCQRSRGDVEKRSMIDCNPQPPSLR